MTAIHDTTCEWQAQFPVSPEHLEEFRERVALGREAMSQTRGIICGLARNIELRLSATIVHIERLGSMFADYRVVIYENDSVDQTRELLFAWSQVNSRVTILSEDRRDPVNPTQRCLERASRMAHYRNCYRQYIADKLADFEYVLVVDTDLVGGWSCDGVANTFSHDNWDFVGSNGIIEKRTVRKVLRLQYDAWAFRRYGSDEHLSTKAVNYMSWQRGEPMAKVNSCFGGLGVYRSEAMIRSQYSGSDCEHVVFHSGMRSCGLDRLWLNPSQMTFYGVRFSRVRRLARKSLRQPRKLARTIAHNLPLGILSPPGLLRREE